MKKNRNRTNFYWTMLLMYTIWQYWNLCGWFFSDFGINIYTQIYTWKYFKQCVLISCALLKSLNQNIYIRDITTVHQTNYTQKLDIIINFDNFSCLVFLCLKSKTSYKNPLAFNQKNARIKKRKDKRSKKTVINLLSPIYQT